VSGNPEYEKDKDDISNFLKQVFAGEYLLYLFQGFPFPLILLRFYRRP
jgi:hypothetical protein